MNHTQTQMTADSRTSVPRALFWLVAMMPALSFILIPFSWQLSQLVDESLSPSFGESSFLYVLLVFVIPSVLVPSLIALVTTLIFPVVIDKRNALLFAVPVLIVHLYIYSIQPFFNPNVVDPRDFREDFGFQLIWTLVFFVPLGMLSFLSTALFSRWGSRTRRSR